MELPTDDILLLKNRLNTLQGEYTELQIRVSQLEKLLVEKYFGTKTEFKKPEVKKYVYITC